VLFQQYSVRFRELPRSTRYAAPQSRQRKKRCILRGYFYAKKAQKNARPAVENHGGRACGFVPYWQKAAMDRTIHQTRLKKWRACFTI